MPKPIMKNLSVVFLALSAILLTFLATPAKANLFLIDLNTLAGTGALGGTWNTYAEPDDINGGVLKDSTGSTVAGVTLSRAGTITDSTNSGASDVFDNTNPDSLPAWATSSTDNAASGDYFFTDVKTQTGDDSFILTIDGLTMGRTFSLDLLASRNEGNAVGFYEYSLNDGTTWNGLAVLNSNGTLATTDGWDTNNTKTQPFEADTQGYDLHRYMSASAVALTGTTLQIRAMDINDTGSYSVLNAIRLNLVPEPATLGLVLLGLTALVSRRRRRPWEA